MNIKKLFSFGCCALVVLGLAGCGNNSVSKPVSHGHSVATAYKANMRTPINYKKSSETKPYPKNITNRDRIIVSLRNQRAYLQKLQNSSFKTVYTFYISSGKNVKGRRTPKGIYHINQYRSNWFYSPQEHEGAKDAVGWKGPLYLFHETPSNQNKQIIKPVAKDLGKRGSSYGCIHLSIPDADWFYHNIPKGMTVIIK